MIEIKKFDINLDEVFGNLKNGKSKWCKYQEKYSVLQDNEVNKWIQDCIQQFASKGKDPSKFGITGYINELQKYCNFFEVKKPKELLMESLDDRNSRLREYLTELLKQGKNEASVKNATQSKVKSFYSHRGSPITFQLECLDSGINSNEIILITNTIRLMEERLSPQYKLIMKIQSQLGLRISDVLDELTSSKYKIEEYNGYYFIRNFMTQKEKIKINYIFFPKELSILLQSVMNCKDLTKLDLKTLFKSRYENSDNRIDGSNYLKRIKEILEDLGLKGNLKTHSFRKWFSSQGRKSGVNIEFSEHLMGHKGQNLSSSYNNNLKDIEWYFTQWKISEKNILINSEIVDQTDKEVLELKEENTKLKRRLDQTIEKNVTLEEKFNNLENQFSEIKSIVSKLIPMEKEEFKDLKKLKQLKNNSD